MNVATLQFKNRNTVYFSEESLQKLMEQMHKKSYEKGSKLYFEGEISTSLFLVVDGKVKLTKLSEDGKELTMYNYFEGDLFGEYVSLNDPFNSYTAHITEHSTIGMIQRKDVETLMKQSSTLAMEYALWMSQNHRYTQMKLRDLLLYGKNGALASILIRMANTYGKDEENRIVITRKFTNIEVAKLIGATRETVNRLLTKFKEDRLIDYDYGKIEIIDLDGLRKINQCENCPPEICRL